MPGKKSSMKSLRAYEIIRDMILNGSKLPGTRLVLSELETELGIGRGPIREAIMRLDRSGLVKNIPYKGAVVATPPTIKEILHIYDLRVELETKLAIEAIPNLTDKDFFTLENLINSMENLSNDRYKYKRYKYEREFHNSIYKASHLHHLCQVAVGLTFSVESVMNIYRWNKTHCEQFNKEHRAILEALKNKDAQKVTETLSINIKSVIEIIKDTYKNTVHIPFK